MPSREGPPPAYPPPNGLPVYPAPSGAPVRFAAPDSMGAVASVVGTPTRATIPLNKLAPEAALRRLELTIVRRLEGYLHGDHLAWLQSRLSVLLVCGQGRWEDSTGALPSTRHMAGLLARKGIRHELDLWGHDVPHDWPSWRAQLAHHLPRFC